MIENPAPDFWGGILSFLRGVYKCNGKIMVRTKERKK